MDEEQSQAGQRMSTEPEDRTPEDVRADIEQTRAELGDTVEALASKTDVKGQAKRAVNDARTTVNDKAAEIKHNVSLKRDGAVSAVQEATPESAGDAGRRVSLLAQQNRSTLMSVAALILGVFIGRRRTR